MIQKTIIIILFILTSNTLAQENSIWTVPEQDSLLVIMEHAYNLEFKKFDEKLARYIKKHPERPEGVFAPVVVWWIKVSTDIYNPKYDDIFIEAIDSVIDRLELIEEEDALYPVAEFYIHSATGFKGIMHVTRGNWFSAALDGRIAVQGVEQALRGEVPNPDAKFGTGLYLYYADILPEKYPILKPLFYFYPEGDKEQGLKDLMETVRYGVFAKVVASYMYCVILFTREKNYLKAYQIMSRLSTQYPKNPTFIMLQAGLATRIRKYSTALEKLDIFKERIANNAAYYPETKLRKLNYRYGDVYYRKKDFKKALLYLNQALEPMEGILEERYFRYKVYSLLVAGYCYKQLGQLDKALAQFNEVLNFEDKRGSHEQAEKEIEKIYALQNQSAE